MRMQPNTGTPNLEALFLAEEARRKQNKAKIETRETYLLRTLKDRREMLIENRDLYKEFMETFFYIRPKGRGIEKFKVNTSQEVLLDAYFIMKANTPFVRLNILKGRQQGMSTMIGACAIMEMLIHPSTGALIATENQSTSGVNLFRMYELYMQKFQEEMQEHLPQSEWMWQKDITDRFSFGKECFLANDSLFSVVGETNVTSKTLQFIHLSEAAFYHHLDECMGMMLQTLPKEPGTSSSMFIETTAKMYGNHHHEGWLAACSGKSAFLPLFLPWYIHQPYAHPIKDVEKFKKSLGQSDDHQYGNEQALLDLDNSKAPWRKMWNGIDFEKYGYDNITLENLAFRRFTINELDGNINEFNRQYPSTPEMAFLSKSAHVLDMEAIRWYIANRQREPKVVGMMEKAGHQRSRFVQRRGGIITIWEEPIPNKEYIIGVDVAEGFDSGDFSCAYVISRLPMKIVARLRGAEGRTVRLQELEEQLAHLGFFYNNAWICVENNLGEAVTQGLARLAYPRQIRESSITRLPSPRFGWRSTTGLRDRGVSFLQEIVSNRHIDIPCEVFLDESHHFHYVNGKPQAARKGLGGVGSLDDSMFALIGALLANDCLPRAKTEMEVREEIHIQKQRKANQEHHRNSKKFSDYKRFV